MVEVSRETMADKLEFEWSDLKTIPNMLSISRLVLVPALIIPYAMEDEYLAKIVFLVMFIIIGLTDKLDGVIARRLNQTSQLGAKLDAMADYVFYPMIAFWLYHFTENVVEGWWWYWVFLLLGLFIVKTVLGRIKFGFMPPVHTIGGKAFAAGLYFFMIIAVLYPDVAATLFPVLMIIGYLNQIEESIMFITHDHIDHNTRSIFKNLKGPFQYK